MKLLNYLFLATAFAQNRNRKRIKILKWLVKSGRWERIKVDDSWDNRTRRPWKMLRRQREIRRSWLWMTKLDFWDRSLSKTVHFHAFWLSIVQPSTFEPFTSKVFTLRPSTLGPSTLRPSILRPSTLINRSWSQNFSSWWISNLFFRWKMPQCSK